MLLPMVFYTRDVYDNKASFANMRRNFSQQNNFKQTSEPKKEKNRNISLDCCCELYTGMH